MGNGGCPLSEGVFPILDTNIPSLRFMQQTATKYGIMAGIGTVLFLLVFYFIDKAYATNPFVSFSTLFFVVLGMVMACRAYRSDNGGNLTKKEALKISFTVAVVSGLFFYSFLYVLFKFIDPGLNEILQEKAIAADPAAVGHPYQMTIGNVVWGYAFSLIYGFLLSLMVSNFVKK